jgi:esterase/lipase superfamily enzyme
MRIVRHGRSGAPIVYAPSSGGDEAEFEAYGFDRVASPWIERGVVQVFSVDGRGPATWWDETVPPAVRVERYARVERYLRDEVLPWIRDVTRVADVAAVGCSYGALVAANLFLKRGDVVRLGAGFGGVYGLWHRLDGHHDGEVYFHTPLEYLPGLEDRAILDVLRANRGFDLYAAADDPWASHTERMAGLLSVKQVAHGNKVWPSPADHHERWWRAQWRDFLGRRFGAAAP